MNRSGYVAPSHETSTKKIDQHRVCIAEVGMTGWTLCNPDKLRRNVCCASEFSICGEYVSLRSQCIGKNINLCSKVQRQIERQFHTMQFLMHRMRTTELLNAQQAYTFISADICIWRLWKQKIHVAMAQERCYWSDVIAAEFIVITPALYICFPIIDVENQPRGCL